MTKIIQGQPDVLTPPFPQPRFPSPFPFPATRKPETPTTDILSKVVIAVVAGIVGIAVGAFLKSCDEEDSIQD